MSIEFNAIGNAILKRAREKLRAVRSWEKVGKRLGKKRGQLWVQLRHRDTIDAGERA